MTYQICGFRNDQIEQVWPHVEHLVRRATDKSEGRFQPEHIRQFLDARTMQLWAVHDGNRIEAIAVTKIETWPTGLKEGAVILTAGGDVHSWISDLVATLEAWASEAGCKLGRVNGRKGWQRLLPDYQWSGVTLEKRI